MSSPANTHLWIPGRVCLVDMCGLFSLTAELFMLLTLQWSTPSTWASNISVEIKKKGVGRREVGQGGVDPEGIRGAFKAPSVCCTMTLGSMKAKVLKTDNTFFSCIKSKCAISRHSWVMHLTTSEWENVSFSLAWPHFAFQIRFVEAGAALEPFSRSDPDVNIYVELRWW